MTLCVLDSDKLADLPADLPRPPRATISMTPQDRVYLTVVTTTIAGTSLCLYAETHAEPRIPEAVAQAVEQFNTDPAVWDTLVSEALDAEDENLDEDREKLEERATLYRTTRERLLGKRD